MQNIAENKDEIINFFRSVDAAFSWKYLQDFLFSYINLNKETN